MSFPLPPELAGQFAPDAANDPAAPGAPAPPPAPADPAAPAVPAAPAPAAPATALAPEVQTHIERSQRSLMRELVDELRRPEPARPQPRALPEAPGAMPNPVEDPDGFARWLERRDAYMGARQEMQLEQMRSELNEQTTHADLWTQVRTEEDTRDLARFEDLWRAAFLAEGGRISGDPREFKQRVVSRVKQQVDAIRGGVAAPAAPAPNPTAPAAPAAPAAPQHRTAGLSGGSTPGGSVPTRKPGEPGAASDSVDLVDEIYRMREGSPYF